MNTNAECADLFRMPFVYAWHRRPKTWVLCLFAILLGASNALGDSYWQGGKGDFDTPSAWNPAGVPVGVNAINDSGSNNIVLIRAGDPTWSPWDIRAGDGTGASGAYLQTGSTATVNGWFRLGDSPNSTGYYTLSNGTVNVLLQAHVGEQGVGSLAISGGALTVAQTPFCVGDGDFGAGGSGRLTITGGTVATAIGTDIWLGEGYNNAAGGSGTMAVSGGAVSIGGWFAIGRFGGIGDLELSGGSITILPGTTGNITVATTPSTGIVNQSGGALTNLASQTWIAESGTGVWNLDGGVDVVGTVLLTRLGGASGTFNLNGGDLYAAQILDSGGNGAFNFNGGTLHALSNASPFLAAAGITVKSGGATIDTGANNIAIAQTLANGGGGLTKLGSGTLTLSGGLSFTGPILISGGTLALSAPNTVASSVCTLNGGGGLEVMLAKTGGQLTMPVLSIGSLGGALTLNYGGAGSQSSSPLYASSLSVNGPCIVNVAGYNFAPGQIHLLRYGSRTGGGGFALGTLPAGMVAQIVTNAGNASIDLLISAAAVGGMPWQPQTAPLMTGWAQEVNPSNSLPEYPRPQMVRSNWLTLNGVWQFEFGATNDPVPSGLNLPNVILVPFPMESALSGIMQYAPFSWYRRQFTVPPAWSGRRILLHFEAVDWQSQIYVNGQSVGTHTGGYDPFSFDITPYLNGGTNELIVNVYSPEDAGGEPRGKQTLYPQGIMFTSSSGIWQTVWLEPVPAASIGGLQLLPDIDDELLRAKVNVNGSTNRLRINGFLYVGSNLLSTATVFPGVQMNLSVPAPKLWSPTNPYLYNLQFTLTSNSTAIDAVTSYVGMRKISLGTNDGYPQMLLNNQFVFEFGPLDQGFWPDGIYTAPTDQALESDLALEKELGFNMVRKHIKVEPQRWYYWADQLGILVWQDMPSCNSYTTNSSPPPVNAQDFMAELSAMVTNHWNSPAIVMWDIFNEGQGQENTYNGVGQASTASLVSLVQSLDASRLVDQASGWNYYGVGAVVDAHNYPNPVCPASTTQAMVCGEFGGVALGVAGHTWSPSSSDVPSSQASSTVTPQIQTLVNDLPSLQSQGLSAAVYTEISDVEIELAGLRTFDRQFLKPNLSQMQSMITSITGEPAPSNMPPVLAAIPNATVTADQTMLVTNFAADAIFPSETLKWSLSQFPAGAVINSASGVVSWRPAISQSPSTNLITVVVSDEDLPPLTASQSFWVVVTPPPAPVFSASSVGPGGFQTTVAGAAGPTYSIYAATNLSGPWQLLLTTNPTTMPFTFTDTASPGYQSRFYDVLLGP